LVLYQFRIVVGIALLLHGWAKLSNFAGAHGFFSSLGLPSELLLPITMLEVLGGFAILIGILTRVTAGLVILEMIGIILHIKLSKGFVGGFELELLIMSICISLLITGPGRIPVEYEVLKREIFPKGKIT
jgi:putative oxidoreductase